MPYSLVLKAAIGNALGNKSLFGANYQAFKKVKYRETQCHAEIIKRMVKKFKVPDKTEALFKTAKTYANPVLMYINMKICFLVWLRYSKIYDDCDKDSVDIDTDDFKLSEHELTTADKIMLKRLQAEANQGKGIDRRNSLANMNLKKRTFSNIQTGQGPLRSKSRSTTKIGTILRKLGSSSSKDGKDGEQHAGDHSQKKPEGRGGKKLNSILPIIKDEDLEEQYENSADDSRHVLADRSRFG